MPVRALLPSRRRENAKDAEEPKRAAEPGKSPERMEADLKLPAGEATRRG
ncbi:hypothetical protein GCM10010232_01020 [Streptomyces amakusaensis]|uniref:Uncharacterized protein n=1 Tax=Streptomyces amakusaensis TaxID=67271 RepID=A0ABW0ATA3_9ACTN